MAVTQRRLITSRDLYRFQIVGSPQLSPEGQRVAFTVTVMDEERNGYRSNLWMGSAVGGEPVQFTYGSARDTSPCWSPDGATIAFISNRSGDNEVWLINATGGEARKLTDLKGAVSELQWSPDGKQIVLVAKEPKKDPGDKDTGDVKLITSLRYRHDDDGYHDGRRRHLWLAPARDGEARQLTSGDWDDVMPAWSPDGRHIAFVSNRTPDRDQNELTDLWVVSAAGGEPRQLTASNGKVTTPAWSLDGARIAYQGHQEGPSHDAVPQLLVIPFSGGAATNLTAHLDRPVGVQAMSDLSGPPGQSPIAWSADGRGVYFLASDGGNGRIYYGGLEGDLRALTSGEEVCRTLSLSARGDRLAFWATDPVNPGDVYLLELGTATPRRRQITSINKELLQELSLSRPQAIKYTSPDGQAVEGWIMKPPQLNQGQRCPLVLEVHGGPHSLYGNAFFHEFQFLAAQGYAVLYTNPRGSHGYGREFCGALRGDWGNKDYQDIMAGVDFVLKQGYVDEKRMAVMGGSYGGYMTNWIVGHSNRFKAAVTDRCVSNLHSFYGTTDANGRGLAEWEFGGRPEDNPAGYARMSPITYINNMETPTLIIAGEADYRCPIEQSEQLFIGLKRRGREVEFLRFPEENHNLTRSGQPRHRVQRLEYVRGWLRRWLG